ncbi:MAG: type IV pilus twitching motility protein PilT [Planctomycetia bacterium]
MDARPRPPAHAAPGIDDTLAQSRPRSGSPETDAFLRAVIKAGASDLHVRAGCSPRVRIDGVLRRVEREALPIAEFEAHVLGLLRDAERRLLVEQGSVDIAYDLDAACRFRINVFRQDAGLSVAARLVPRTIPSIDSLRLPPILRKIADAQRGLILVAGVTGSGKSTTMAAMLDHINESRAEHILTIEDPIEFLFTEKKCLINQREVRINVPDFPTALRAMVREDPDVILIGEMRDAETFRAALQAAETGHVVFGTVHAARAAQAIGRVLSLFPKEEQAAVRQSLPFNLHAVICQQLLRSTKTDVRRVPACEVLIATPIVRKLILESRDPEISEVIDAGDAGMIGWTESLYHLCKQGLVDEETACEAAPSAEALRMRLAGIRASTRGIVG